MMKITIMALVILVASVYLEKAFDISSEILLILAFIGSGFVMMIFYMVNAPQDEESEKESDN